MAANISCDFFVATYVDLPNFAVFDILTSSRQLKFKTMFQLVNMRNINENIGAELLAYV